MSAAPHPAHAAEQMCAAGTDLYACALRDGHVSRAAAVAAPCLIDLGLLHPDLDDPSRLRPVSPEVGLSRLLQGIGKEIARQRDQEARLVDAFEPLIALRASTDVSAGPPENVVLVGRDRINARIMEVMAESGEELLTVQPGGKRPLEQLVRARPLEQGLLDRGARMRTLYQHTTRHDPAVAAHFEHLEGDVEVRTLDEIPDRLIVLDRTVAFIPANADRTWAMEVRHRPLVTYLATTFDRLWRLATPMYPQAAPQPALNGITPRQRAIAALLIEGHTDAVIADRLGMNVRTAREHIAKLAATLGSESRAQLGYLIGRSGILDQESEGR